MKARSELYNKLKIDGKIWYAYGEYRNDATSKRFANENAMTIRKKGGKARLITRKTGIQVYSNNKKYVED